MWNMGDIYVFSLHDIHGITDATKRIFYRKIISKDELPVGKIVLAFHEGDLYSETFVEFVVDNQADIVGIIHLALLDESSVPGWTLPMDILAETAKEFKQIYDRYLEICTIAFPFPDYTHAQIEITNQL